MENLSLQCTTEHEQGLNGWGGGIAFDMLQKQRVESRFALKSGDAKCL